MLQRHLWMAPYRCYSFPLSVSIWIETPTISRLCHCPLCTSAPATAALIITPWDMTNSHNYSNYSDSEWMDNVSKWTNRISWFLRLELHIESNLTCAPCVFQQLQCHSAVSPSSVWGWEESEVTIQTLHFYISAGKHKNDHFIAAM